MHAVLCAADLPHHADHPATSQLPDGQQHTHTFKLGATVAYVKLVIQEAHGLPMERVTLTPATGGRPFIDPLSLADCPSIAAAATDGQCLVLVSERESSE
jgi:hypothetical protein